MDPQRMMERLDVMVANGRMTDGGKAEGYLERVRGGEHSPELRKAVRGSTEGGPAA